MILSTRGIFLEGSCFDFLLRFKDKVTVNDLRIEYNEPSPNKLSTAKSWRFLYYSLIYPNNEQGRSDKAEKLIAKVDKEIKHSGAGRVEDKKDLIKEVDNFVINKQAKQTRNEVGKKEENPQVLTHKEQKAEQGEEKKENLSKRQGMKR